MCMNFQNSTNITNTSLDGFLGGNKVSSKARYAYEYQLTLFFCLGDECCWNGNNEQKLLNHG